ncbi:unnamed protein product [Lupinus luteus]|uniref:Uncharacterized protein n=1 Tax=Lupinus luteus TaxID=3873 RepID=A0AAV1Y4R5_LUPLU
MAERTNIAKSRKRYLLKSSVISELSGLALKPSSSDLGALQQLLVDQPNLPSEEEGLPIGSIGH